MTRTGTCSSCGRQILWIEFDGRSVPLDAKATCYVRMEDRETGDEVWVRASQAMVDHAAACRPANRFSGGRRKLW